MLIRVFPPVPASMTRRRLLLGGLGASLLLSVSACTEDPPADLPTDPDRDALEAAKGLEVTTLASLAGWTAGDDDSAVTPTRARAVVGAHISALATALSTPPTTSAPPTPVPSGSESFLPAPVDFTKQVVAALDAAASDHTRALRTASPQITPLLASIAASDAALAAAIRRSSR